MPSCSKSWGFAVSSLTAMAFAGCTNDADLGGRSSSGSGPAISPLEFCANASTPDASPSCGGSSAEKICRDEYTCLVGLLEPEAANVFFECQTPKVCTDDDAPGPCKEEIARKAPLHTAESQRCFARYTECRKGSTDGKDPFDDDLCEYVVGMKADILSEYAPCFEKECGEVQGCLAGVLAARGLDDCPE